MKNIRKADVYFVDWMGWCRDDVSLLHHRDIIAETPDEGVFIFATHLSKVYVLQEHIWSSCIMGRRLRHRDLKKVAMMERGRV